MEALIVAIFVLITIVVVDAAYGIAIAIVRRTPVLGVAVLAGWIAHRNGADLYEVMGVALVSAILMRHLTIKCAALIGAMDPTADRYERPTLIVELRAPD